jgi:hypothetical protein
MAPEGADANGVLNIDDEDLPIAIRPVSFLSLSPP